MNDVPIPNRDHDVFHIVGQGLAGSLLALLLLDQGFSVHVHDDGYKTSSSRVAAGMWNPLSFVNLKASWKALEMADCIETMYPRLEEILGATFFHPTPLMRIFPDAGSANLWEERMSNMALRTFMSDEARIDAKNHFRQPHGHGMVQRAGWLDVPAFQEASKSHFQGLGCFTQHEFTAVDQHKLLNQGHWVILCTGWKMFSADFGIDLPLVPNKGQVYTLEIPGLDADYMSNFGKFTIPLGNGLFRVGSTYEHRPADSLPSPAAQEILDDVAREIKHPFKVCELQAGYRPTTIDRFPIIGLHQQHHRLGIFTGFGSRGVVLVPLCAQDFIQHLTTGSPLMSEVNWQRFERRKKK